MLRNFNSRYCSRMRIQTSHAACSFLKIKPAPQDGMITLRFLSHVEFAIRKLPFMLAAVLVIGPLALVAQAPAPNADKPDSAVSQEPEAGEANESAKLALKLTNPVASLISIPIQNWFDFNLGPKKDGFRYTMEAQPVYPMQISSNWNLISRTTIPVIYQQNLYGRTT